MCWSGEDSTAGDVVYRGPGWWDRGPIGRSSDRWAATCPLPQTLVLPLACGLAGILGIVPSQPPSSRVLQRKQHSLFGGSVAQHHFPLDCSPNQGDIPALHPPLVSLDHLPCWRQWGCAAHDTYVPRNPAISSSLAGSLLWPGLSCNSNSRLPQTPASNLTLDAIGHPSSVFP